MADKRKYHVGVREVHISTMEIEAESAAEAVELVMGGDGAQTMCEYSWTMDSETWTVEEEK